jgi:acyl-CoA thioester hydrolase
MADEPRDTYEFEHRIRVRYCETDRMGVAHHGSYLAWFEEARTELMRRRGLAYRGLEDRGFMLPVVDLAVRYERPVTYDDEIVVWVAVREKRRASLTFCYEVRSLDGCVVATATTTLACVGRDGRLRRLPDGV